MIESSVTRRAVIHRALTGGAAAAAVTTLGCSPGQTTKETPMPTPPAPPRCVSLADHQFRSRNLCGTDETTTADQDDRDIMQLRWFGPLYATSAVVTSYYVDAVVQWDAATGAAQRLLAPKRADTWAYALAGEACVNHRCDGTLTVHVDGCLVAELEGHRGGGGGAPVLGIVPLSGGRVASVGRDATVRVWDVAGTEQTAALTLPSSDSDWTIHPAGGGDQIVAAALDGSAVLLLEADTLARTGSWGDLPATVDGWQMLPDGRLVGASADRDRREVLIVEPGQGPVGTIPTRRVPTALAVSSTGAVAVGDLTRVLVVDPAEGSEPEPRVMRTSLAWCHAVTFSPDGQVLYLADGPGGVVAMDVTSGTILTTMERPEHR